MAVERRHEQCPTCDWLAREAGRTATEYGQDHWSSYTTDRDGTEHAARYWTSEAARFTEQDHRQVAEKAWDEGFANGIAYQAGNNDAWENPYAKPVVDLVADLRASVEAAKQHRAARAKGADHVG